MFWIFRPRNAPMSLLTITAELLAAAISAVLEWGAADTVRGWSQDPASGPSAFVSPM
jgi:hypothetical protein